MAGSRYTVQVVTVAQDGITEGSAATLVVFTKPAAVTGLRVNSTTSTTALLSWTLPSGNTSNYSIVIGGNLNPMTVNTSYVNVTGLVPLSQYTISVTAVTEDGTKGDATSISLSTTGVSLRYRLSILSLDGLDAQKKNLILQKINTVLQGEFDKNSFSASWTEE
ncbi:receptor-type tyrosine-protein phosphatase eta-like [Polypterus senegalus]|uniref:receptor-type tyrosine-protein phosphatase eta-like n=1 Tax=Polypterus senegalus TaxID=55291 RepID=UPI0019662C21|nr:receptor-type tyrosine-protein phosphatase eta-like [Polypterus senegalus]